MKDKQGIAVVFDFTLNSSKEESKTSVSFMQGERTKLRLSNRKLISSSKGQ